MRILRAVVLVAVASLLLSLFPGVDTWAAPAWTPPEVLGAEATAVDMDVNAAGDAVALWVGDAEVKASYRPAGRNWQKPQLLSASAGARDTDLIGVFLSDAGRATAVWSEGWRALHVMDRGRDGVWRRDPISELDWTGNATYVADADDDGNLAITWHWYDDLASGEAHGSWRSSTGTWEAGPSGAHYGEHAMTARRGLATIVAPTINCDCPREAHGLRAKTSRLGGMATSWKQIWAGAAVEVPVMASNTAGDLVLATVERPRYYGETMEPGSTRRLVVLSKPAGQPWREVSVPGGWDHVRRPAVAISDSGLIGVTYQRADDSVLEVRTGSVQSGELGEPTVLAASAQDAPASIAMSPDGSAAVTWVGSNTSGDASAFASHHPAGGGWAAATQLGPEAGGAAVHAYPNGMFTALLLDGAASWSDHVDDTVGPRAWLRAPRREISRTTSVSVRWTSADALSRPLSTDVRVRAADRSGAFGTWSRWKSNTTRTSGVFAGRPGHTYCFAVRGRDRVGNVGAWSRRRCITIPVDDRAFTATGGWNRVGQRTAYQRSLTVTTDAGQRLRLPKVRARSLRLLSRTCATCGTVRVTHGGRPLGTFDLTSRRTRNRTILLAKYSRPRSGAIMVRVLSDEQPVWIDGLAATP